MPRHWWHHVTSRDPYNGLVNFWWGGRSAGLEDPYAAFVSCILAMRTLPEAEQAYWRAMIDTYVFADGAAHLPPSTRGTLGRPTRTSRQHRQRLKSAAQQT